MASIVFPETFFLRPRATVALRAIYRLERVVAALLLAAALPLMAVIAVVVAVLARRSPLVRHVRVGWRGEPLAMLKFRTMWGPGTPRSAIFTIEEVQDHIPEIKGAPDPRVTSRFAAWCRRRSIDELPQLYHVVRGEMSFVGPRPITRTELDRYYGPSALEVLSLRPGLVGLWQVMGRNHLTYARRRRLDLLMVRHASAALYLRILARSVTLVLGGNGAF
ncbi:MAG TPA: sugar transferase [Bryobacteraceae bacterium]|jgi:lipopolysaccharide/colanic/teichoic acid biosynthesis glycosyltransferase